MIQILAVSIKQNVLSEESSSEGVSSGVTGGFGLGPSQSSPVQGGVGVGSGGSVIPIK